MRLVRKTISFCDRQIITQIVCAVLGVVIVPTALMAQSAKDKSADYLCTAEAEGGIAFDKSSGTWKGTSFDIRTDDKFVLRLKFIRSVERIKVEKWQKDETFDVYEVTITQSGTIHTSSCQQLGKKEIYVAKSNTIFCSASLVDYKINLDTNRYLAVYAVGYAVGLVGKDEDSDTPAIKGGTCTKTE